MLSIINILGGLWERIDTNIDVGGNKAGSVNKFVYRRISRVSLGTRDTLFNGFFLQGVGGIPTEKLDFCSGYKVRLNIQSYFLLEIVSLTKRHLFPL